MTDQSDVKNEEGFFPYENDKRYKKQKKMSLKLKQDSKKKVEPGELLEIGAKTILGISVGAITGVAAITLAAAAGEIVLIGSLTKLCGLAGGAMGLSWGLKSSRKEKLEMLKLKNQK